MTSAPVEIPKLHVKAYVTFATSFLRLPMESHELKRLEVRNLPWYFRLLLKIPAVNLLGNVSSGLFWALVVPIFMALESFLTLFLLIYFAFPVNVAFAAIIPAFLLLAFMRISLERFLNWWNSSVADTKFDWDIDRDLPGYLEKIKKAEQDES